jgi:hypothetical protein
MFFLFFLLSILDISLGWEGVEALHFNIFCYLCRRVNVLQPRRIMRNIERLFEAEPPISGMREQDADCRFVHIPNIHGHGNPCQG